jgi:putative tryptophan/tyrosine transport system substrate-binding protein
VDQDKEKQMKKKLTVLTLCAILFALCVPTHAQQPTKIPRIGYLSGGFPSAGAPRTDALRLGLRELGYVEGKNIVIDIDTQRENSIAFPPLQPS